MKKSRKSNTPFLSNMAIRISVFIVLSIAVFFYLKNVSKKNIYCKNELELIKPKKVKVFDIKLLSEKKQAENSLKKINSNELFEVHFGVKIDDLAIIAYYVKQKNHLTYLHRRIPIGIYLNEKNKVLVTVLPDDDYVVRLDSFSDFFSKKYRIYKFPYINKIRLNWTENVSGKSIKSIILQIVNSYFKAVNRIALKKYDKPLCKLNQNELKAVKKIFPFELELENYSFDG